MISIIVPVYNVEPFLRRCLNSIVNQTYDDLEILIIDDGSTDNSGDICDEYKRQDERVKVFHTKNRGLSAARNLGLDEAKGEWIGFVDSDDWIELDMYEVLLKKAEDARADVVECGWVREWPKKIEERSRQEQTLSRIEAVEALVCKIFSDNVWNKIWKSKCFDNIRFPNGRIYEDIATTYRIFATADCICSINEIKYHYVQRKNSITKKNNINNLMDGWLSHYERYRYIEDWVDESTRQVQIKLCADAAARIWSNYYDFDTQERKNTSSLLYKVNSFTKEYIPLFGFSGWELRCRIGSIFPRYFNNISFRVAWIMNRVYKSLVFYKYEMKMY